MCGNIGGFNGTDVMKINFLVLSTFVPSSSLALIKRYQTHNAADSTRQ